MEELDYTRDGKRVVLIDTFSLLQASTGIKSYMIELADLAKRSNDFARYLPYPQVHRIHKIKFFKKANFFRKHLFHISYFLWKTVFLPLMCLRFRAHAIICPDFVAPPWRMKAIKIVVVHDASFWKYPENYGSQWRRYFTKLISLGLRGKACIVATSHYTKDSIKEYWSPKIPIHVTYQSLGYLENRIAHQENYLEGLNLQSEKFILHVGFFAKRKNLRTLLKAFNLFLKVKPGYKLVLAGGKSTDAYMDDYHQVSRLIKSLALEKDVVLPGYVSVELLGQLYKGALMYVFPSYEEGFGIPTLEAMYYHLPVIVSKDGALPEIGGDAVLTYDTFDEKDLFEKMCQIEEDPDLQTELIRRGTLRFAEISREKFYDTFDRLIMGS